ncbi:MAG: glycosyltransferase [Ketobacter sp.]|nr:MAG: glycosyltransferase [Ketobacter sp.]
MHQSAMYYGQRFFELYCADREPKELTIVEIGSQDVNGSLREVSPDGAQYIGLDFVGGKGVDIVIDDPYRLPLQDESADVIVSSSCFEHSQFFWLVFLEAMRALKKGGVLYLNAPSNGFYHRWPVDCWRFYPDSGHALAAWAQRNGFNAKLLESFVGQRSDGKVSDGGGWSDFVAVFIRDEKYITKYPKRMVDSLAGFYNGYSCEQSEVLNFDELGPDFSLIEEQGAGLFKLEQQLVARDDEAASLRQQSLRYKDQVAGLTQRLADYGDQIKALEQKIVDRDLQIENLVNETVIRGEWALRLSAELEDVQARLAAIVESKSLYVTKPLRELRRWYDNPGYQSHRYMRAGTKMLKRRYQSLPLSAVTRARHRNLLSSVAPKLLLVSGSPSGTIPSLAIPETSSLASVITPSKSRQFDMSQLRFRETESPLVSVIIPVFGKIEYTLSCLESIANNLPETPFEIIVVDDCSTDESAEVLQKIQGIRLISNAVNQGFIRSCNVGAEAAVGEYLLFLNNDTQVNSGWLDALYQTFSDFPGTGLVGSKLVYPDGRLQEAGGIIWQDGSAWNFGRLQDQGLPSYNYAREVDYCSGASILVPKTLFEELLGFDEHYLPAYCEDSDLALKIRHRGFRVIYQPMSVVTHFEGITSGTDTAQGTKSYQTRNTQKLFNRWENQLKVHQMPGVDVDDAKDRRAKHRVLVLDHCTPTPDQDAGSVTVFNLLLLLREMDFQVTFIPEDNFLYMPGYTTELQKNGIEVLYAPYFTTVAQHVKESGKRYDLAFLFRPGVVERHIGVIKKYCSNAKVLYHTVDLHYLRMQREAELQQDNSKLKLASEMKQRELLAVRSCDASIVHSTAELELLRPELPMTRLHVFPLILDVRGTEMSFDDRRDLIFVGGYQHAPNADAVKYMVDEIMPLLRYMLPGVRFYAVGSQPPEYIQSLACEDVIVTGFVEDLSEVLDKMRVSVAPLRFGAGIKGKIGSAMASGLPVVTTSLGAEGMSLSHGENVLIADGSKSFAEAVVRLYQDSDLWKELSEGGVEFSNQAWGAESAWNTLVSILSDLELKIDESSYPIKLYKAAEAKKSAIEKRSIPKLEPVLVARNRAEYESGLKLHQNRLSDIQAVGAQLTESTTADAFTVEGECVPCNKKVPFLIDMQSGGQVVAGKREPNWRERVVCPSCQMNNRQRLIATLVDQYLSGQPSKKIYFMEQVTPIYQWALNTFSEHEIFGSEYLGYEYPGGKVIRGIRHEDIENLSFPDESLDLIVSNDVFEHVPHPAQAFAECARALKPSGIMLATIPFHQDIDESVHRSKILNGKLTHILPPAYHGNPVSSDGSLVFTDFGWSILPEMRAAGFSEVEVKIYASAEYGHLGAAQIIFYGKKCGKNVVTDNVERNTAANF